MKHSENQQNSSLKSKIENFWYYYKVPAIIILIVILIVGFLISENRGQVVSDLNISLVSAEALTESTINFNEALPGVIRDINGDGEANITISRLFIGEDLKEKNAETYLQTLESQLAGKGATLFIFDKINYDRMAKKDAFCPLDTFFDVSQYSDRVLYRNDEPIAFHLTGSKVLADMGFTSDDLYALLLFQRPEDESDPASRAEYENAAAVLSALMMQS